MSICVSKIIHRKLVTSQLLLMTSKFPVVRPFWSGQKACYSAQLCIFFTHMVMFSAA